MAWPLGRLLSSTNSGFSTSMLVSRSVLLKLTWRRSKHQVRPPLVGPPSLVCSDSFLVNQGPHVLTQPPWERSLFPLTRSHQWWFSGSMGSSGRSISPPPSLTARLGRAEAPVTAPNVTAHSVTGWGRSGARREARACARSFCLVVEVSVVAIPTSGGLRCVTLWIVS